MAWYQKYFSLDCGEKTISGNGKPVLFPVFSLKKVSAASFRHFPQNTTCFFLKTPTFSTLASRYGLH